MAKPPGRASRPTWGDAPFGAVKKSVRPPARTAPPAMKPTVDTVASVTALLRSFTAAVEHPAWPGHSRWADFQADEARIPKTAPRATPATPTPLATSPTVRCAFPAPVDEVSESVSFVASGRGG